jgi:hypothetical protein
MIVDAWMSAMANIIKGEVENPSILAVGLDDTTATENDIALVDEYKEIDIDSITKTGNDEVTIQGTIPVDSGNGQIFKEYGFLNDSKIMMNRDTHTGILKSDSFELMYQVVVKFSRG